MSHRLLIVEEDKVELSLYQDLLAEIGTTCETALTNDAFEDKVTASGLELVIFSLAMFDVDKIRALIEKYPTVHWIATTPFSQLAVAIGLVQEGLAGYMRKPISAEEFKAVVLRSIKKSPDVGDAKSQPFKLSHVIQNLSKFTDIGSFAWTLLNEIKSVVFFHAGAMIDVSLKVEAGKNHQLQP